MMLVTKEIKKSIREADIISIRFKEDKIELETRRLAMKKNGWSKPEEIMIYKGENSSGHSQTGFYCPCCESDAWKALNLMIKNNDYLFFTIRIDDKKTYKQTALRASIYRKQNFVIFDHVLKSIIEEKI